MKILLSGSSGLVGSALTESLFKEGHTITCLQRNKDAKTDDNATLWNTATLDLSNPDTYFDVVIHLAGENIAEGRWSKAKKARILKSRVEGTQSLVDFLIKSKKLPKLFMAASAVGYYGNRGDEVLNEMSRKGTGFLSDVCLDWETEVNKIAAHGTRVVNLRFGMVLSPEGGALHKMLPPFKVGLGGTLSSGNQYVSWISIRDIVRIVSFTMQNETISGPINVVAPQAITNATLTKELGQVLGKPAFLRVPILMIAILFGSEMTQEMMLASTRATPERLIRAGYKYKDASLKDALTYCLNKEK